MKTSIRSRKNTLRADLLARRAALAPAFVAEASAAICRQVIKLCRLHPTHSQLFLFAGIRQEPDLLPLLGNPALANLDLAFPVVVDNETMVYRHVAAISSMAPGRFGILEPVPEAPLRDASRQTIVLIPALAFSQMGERLGYGGGFYDRYLSAHPQAIRVGVCYDDFFLPKLPVSQHDIPVHYVLTEQRLERVS